MSEQETNVLIGQRLKWLRKAAKVTQTQAGAHLWLVKDVIARMEAGQQRITLYRLKLLAELYGVPWGFVLDDEHWEGVNGD